MVIPASLQVPVMSSVSPADAAATAAVTVSVLQSTTVGASTGFSGVLVSVGAGLLVSLGAGLLVSLGAGLLVSVGAGLLGAGGCAGWVNVTVIVLLVVPLMRVGFTSFARSFTVGLLGRVTCVRYLPFLLVVVLPTATHLLPFLRSSFTFAFATGCFLSVALPLTVTGSPATGSVFGPLRVSFTPVRLPVSTAAVVMSVSAASAAVAGTISPVPSASTPVVAISVRRIVDPPQVSVSVAALPQPRSLHYRQP